jgi:hypothetical protein
MLAENEYALLPI